MSTPYLTRAAPVLQYFGFDSSRIPEELWGQVERRGYEGGRLRDNFVIGTSFANGRTNRATTSDNSDLTPADFAMIELSGKPFYSKWDKGSPLLLFDKHRRFVYHTAGREFWESLPKNIRVSAQDLKVNTLGKLMDALYGPNAYMEAVEGMQQGIYKGDPTTFASWWIEFGGVPGVPNKEIQAESSLEQIQEHYQRTFNIDTLLFALGMYGYETKLQQPDVTIVATQRKLPREDRIHYVFHIDEKAGETAVTGQILFPREPSFDPSEESDEEYLKRGLTDIIEEHDLQVRVERELQERP
tara:strand:+ start:482 stop:1378 length:897 start_codon:yes stop_codon:yes gene_type:complete